MVAAVMAMGWACAAVARPAEEAEWMPFDHRLEIEAGSALDFSSWTDAPAGKHGPVVVRGGHFEFAGRPGKPVRFFGANLNFGANYLERGEAEALALRLRRMGYNAVRFHHYDVLLAGGWQPEGYRIDPQMRDKLDYLFHCMKEQGLSISTDLFTIRRIRVESLKPFKVDNAAVFKALIPIHPDAMAEWKRFASDVLAHRNPYTGMTWAEDPALFSICPVNEDTLYACFQQDPQVEALYREAFKAWPKSAEAPFARFLAEKQMEADREMFRYLREDLGVKALLTGNNWKWSMAQTLMRSSYDYVDNHAYWDHPAFPGKPFQLPHRYSQRSATAHLAAIPRERFLTRVSGKPFMLSEYNYVFPNRHRAEGGPLMGAYAAFQDWDGLFRFGMANDEETAVKPLPIRGFNIADDPIHLLGERIIACLWLRGDMPRLQDEEVFIVTDELAFPKAAAGPPPDFPRAATYVGLTRRVSSRYLAKGGAAGLNAEFLEQAPQPVYRVREGDAEAVLEASGDFLARNPRSMAQVMQTRSIDKDFVPEFDGPAVVFCGSLDGRPLETSERLLVLHLTDVTNTGMAFEGGGDTVLEDYGRLPLRVRAGTARVRIPNRAEAKGVRCYALDTSGARRWEMPVTVEPGTKAVVLELATHQEGGACMAYEIVRTP